MFDLRIGGLHEAEMLIASGWPTKVVRVLRSHDERAAIIAPWYLQIDVDDVSEPEPGAIMPNAKHLEAILAFSASFTDEDRVLVHCFAGLSRSPSVAIAIWLQHGATYDKVYWHLRSIREQMWPNDAFIKLVDHHFKLDGRLIDMIKSHKITFADEDTTEVRVPVRKIGDYFRRK